MQGALNSCRVPFPTSSCLGRCDMNMHCAAAAEKTLPILRCTKNYSNHQTLNKQDSVESGGAGGRALP